MSILALMTSRLLNIWVIKQRASHIDKSENGRRDGDNNTNKRWRSPSPVVTRSSAGREAPPRNSSERRRHRLSLSLTRQRISQFIVRLNDAEHRTMVRLRGKASDIRDITARSWYTLPPPFSQSLFPFPIPPHTKTELTHAPKKKGSAAKRTSKATSKRPPS